MTADRLDLDKIDTLHANIEWYGPWTLTLSDEGSTVIDPYGNLVAQVDNDNGEHGTGEWIAWCRTGVPGLVAELRAERVRSEQLADALRGYLVAYEKWNKSEGGVVEASLVRDARDNARVVLAEYDQAQP